MDDPRDTELGEPGGTLRDDDIRTDLTGGSLSEPVADTDADDQDADADDADQDADADDAA